MLGIGIGISPSFRHKSPIPLVTLVNPSLQFNGVDSLTRHTDSVNWTLPNADWTMGVLVSVTSNEGTGASHFMGSGSPNIANTWNFLSYKDGNANTRGYEFNLHDGTTNISVFGLKTDGFRDDVWRLWTIERNKTAETINIYRTDVNGTRNLYATASTTGLLAVDGTVNPGVGARVAPTAGGPNWTNGKFHSFFKINSLLTDTETAQLANGKDLITDLGKAPNIYMRYNSIVSPLVDRGSAGNNGTISGTVTLVDGPVFIDQTLLKVDSNIVTVDNNNISADKG